MVKGIAILIRMIMSGERYGLISVMRVIFFCSAR